MTISRPIHLLQMTLSHFLWLTNIPLGFPDVCSNCIGLHATVQHSQDHLLKRLFPIIYSCLLHCRLIVHRCVGLFLVYFCSAPLIRMSGFVSRSCHFDYCSFVILSKIWEDYASCLVLFSLNCLGSSGSFVVPYTFLDYLF